jgi:outer membrane protein assembly factor BamE (lipoprotein component of BamABCDE complex)
MTAKLLEVKKMIAVLILLLIVIGCSAGSHFKADTFSKDDMCIVQTDGGKDKICYGMTRSDVEKILGIGQQGQQGGLKNIEYDTGVSIFYRNDVVAGVSLEQGSQSKFKTSRGAEIGMTKADIKKVYGEKYAVEHGERNLDYIYDSVTDKFLNSVSLNKEESVNAYIFSVILDSTAVSADRITLLDMRMARYFE